MDLTFIAKTLNDNIDVDTRILTLESGVPLGEPVTALFDGYLNGGPLVVKGASVSTITDPDRVLLTGVGDSFPFKGLKIRAYFTVAGDDAVLDLIGNPSGDWNLSIAFPVLKDSKIAKLEFNTAAMTLRSSNVSSPGMTVAGTLKLAGQAAGVVTLLKDVADWTLRSDVTIEGENPSFSLSSTTPRPLVEIGNFKSMQGGIVASVKPVKDSFEARLYLKGDLTYTQGGEDRTIDFTIDLIDPDSKSIHFEASASEADLGIRELAELLGIKDAGDIAGAVPPVFSAVDNFVFDKWEMNVSRKAQVEDTTLTVVTRRPWNVVPDLLEFDIDAITLSKDFSKKKDIQGDVAAKLTFKQPKPAVMEITAGYPGFQITGEGTGEPIDVRWLVGRYLSQDAASLLPGDFKIVDPKLTADPPSGAFTVSGDVDLDWDIDFKVASFKVENLNLELKRVAQATSGSIVGNFRLGNIEPPVLADVTATYDDEAWSFEGGLNEASTVSFDQVMAAYFPDWSGTPLEVTLKTLRVSFTPGEDSSYGVAGSAELAIDLGIFKPSIDASMDLEYETAEDSYSGFLKGELDIFGFPLSAELTYPEQQVALFFAGIKVDVTTKPQTKLTITFPDKSLGDLIALLVSAAVGEDYTLTSPWNVLNRINLQDFKLEIEPGERKIGLVYAPKSPVDLGFGTLKGFTLTYTRPESGKPNTTAALH